MAEFRIAVAMIFILENGIRMKKLKEMTFSKGVRFFHQDLTAGNFLFRKSKTPVCNFMWN
jgi:hypothetical protein